MLSAKGRVCKNKVYILDKLQTLRNRLQGYIDQGAQKVQKREADEAAAKLAWLDAESQYVISKKKAEDADATVAQDLKRVESLTSLLGLNKARLAKVRASVTEQLSEIDEEEAIIRELLGYIGDLHSSTVDVVSSLLPAFSDVAGENLPRPCMRARTIHFHASARHPSSCERVPSSTVDVVRTCAAYLCAPKRMQHCNHSWRVRQDITSLSQKFGRGVDQLMQRPALRAQAAPLRAFAQ
jgi:hypothetical protein